MPYDTLTAARAMEDADTLARLNEPWRETHYSGSEQRAHDLRCGAALAISRGARDHWEIADAAEGFAKARGHG